MKRLVVILALAVLLGSGAYIVSYGIARCTFCRMPDADDSSSWLRQEFHLSDAQYAQVKKLEADYHPHCIAMCDQIKQSHLALKNLILANGTMTPEIETALQSARAKPRDYAYLSYAKAIARRRDNLLRTVEDLKMVWPSDSSKW